MANKFQSYVVIVDTAMQVNYSSTPTPLMLQPPYKIKRVYWLNPLAVGDTFTITDGAGNTIETGRCETANQSQVFNDYDPDGQSDFLVTQISSGTLYITLHAPPA